MDGYRVWVQPMDHEYRVSVEGMANADRLMMDLARLFVFKSAEPLARDGRSLLCSFQVPCTSLLPFAVFRRLLAAIPGTQLVMQPALA